MPATTVVSVITPLILITAFRGQRFMIHGACVIISFILLITF